MIKVEVKIKNFQKIKTYYLSLFVHRNICIEIIFITICYQIYSRFEEFTPSYSNNFFNFTRKKQKKKRKFVHLLVSFVRRKFNFVIIKRIL